jgi:hypothetical protein
MRTVLANNILRVTLNSIRLYDDVLKQIGESQLPYVSPTSRSLLLEFNQDNLKQLKKLWKSLLIDSICILKVNDSREKIYYDSANNIQKFLDNFDDIRLTSSYGIDDIARYFDDFIDFESVLYGTDSHYRDHVDHVLQVWAIGVNLIAHNKFELFDDYTVDNDYDFHFEIPNEKNKNVITNSELWAIWTVIALCHDLGYPIEKTAKINIQAKKIIGHFGNMNFSELNYSFDIFNSFLVDKFLNLISSKAIRKNPDQKSDKEIKITEIQTKYRDKFSKSLEDYKHGIFSSLLLFKNLTYFLESDYYISGDNLSEEDLRQFYIRKEILRSIASHTCPKIYHLSLNTLSFLLILCDELQEWNRPKFDVLIKREINTEPKVEIREYMMTPYQKIHIQFVYDVEIEDKDARLIVDNRFKFIHCILRSAKDDKNRNDKNVFFKWEIEFKNSLYTFIFDSNKDSFDQLSVTKQNKIDNTWPLEQTYNIYKTHEQ